MVCIAAFIILAIVGIVVAFLSIFNRELGKKYLKVFKKSFHCFGKRVRLQKCDTNFSEDVKTAILKKVVIKRPKLVKPLSITLEITSILIVVVTVWSLVEGVKAGLALWTLGTCNVSQPSNCALGADSCSINEDNLNWFTEWGEIFSNIPDRLKTWNVLDYINKNDGLNIAFVTGSTEIVDDKNAVKKVALSIIDPGCSVCMQSYKNLQKDEKFLKNHVLIVTAYPIKNTDGSYRFKNSELISRYILALNIYTESHYDEAIKNANGIVLDEDWARQTLYGYSEKILNRIFTEYNDEHINYQEVFNNRLDNDAASALLDSWLKEWGLSDDALATVRELVHSDEVTNELNHNAEIINQNIKPKGIPTMIYDGKKHLGLFKN
ncbi:hypothetical protein IKF40_01115 [Candidatus Saccharibacteria bacterium]|nr:hypothetical protein [Candidatus Saccharibacteria bacterium]MBR2710729.1 hypothetical protein [Candidatus Saccharibacteria bacterium]MBR2989518.1 hypothetical protein [Candidatus Saccharibacteria bacterium]